MSLKTLIVKLIGHITDDQLIQIGRQYAKEVADQVHNDLGLIVMEKDRVISAMAAENNELRKTIAELEAEVKELRK